ncbi:MAG: hypothetical protein CLLPBCKN_006032 [Chroococcidiopsis cubana SAG 39.79]|uniref:Uncharacterized protein n=1 Tax=Chroococcidiopsis cubana SAG 39.79 TaxID=388085 RepID=A0AB37UGB2_9CYAN|nr:hypothetical protein [Chroococcidiopsis cubana]MDZ4876597.1 hypothetical protein [Chroococcidiopsis cubana SAG 39.79]PSB59665.1 hypothetical protein C7B79_28645 [Chroococcidiopsis cubana CCALA 043]RUT10341.1 hypothetical protein DSM107010_43370 [Chroococcidiopsis cubana SAG 39.79]
MKATLDRLAWTTELETEIFNKLTVQHAPDFPSTCFCQLRSPATREEWKHLCRFRIAQAARNLFIVQVCGQAIDRLPDPEVQLFLSRQIGDDGAHAQHTRHRVWELSGRDPLPTIQQEVQQHWDFMGDLPNCNWLGFVAFQLHYKLHIVAMSIVNSRTAKIGDLETSKFADRRILPDEVFHRLGIVAWWHCKYEQASPQEKANLAAELIQLDDDSQRRRNAYLKEYWQMAHRATGIETEALPAMYDAWRREVLSYLLDIPISQLPKLVSIND